MRRVANLYHLIPNPENLRLAFWKAARGKHHRAEVVEYKANLGENLDLLQRQLVENNTDIGHYRFFSVRDPKPRSICAAAFPERVLHHAIMNVCEPVLDAYSISDSYACRKGKGTRRALSKAQTFTRKYSWYLKLDIRKYFDSVDHTIMMRLLSRRIKDRQILLLFQKLLDSYHTADGKGLPIGNLISQHLANFYLGHFDHWIKEVRCVRPYLRYMDDFIIFSQDKTSLNFELAAIETFLSEKLGLELKPNIQLNRCRFGLPFLGYRVYPNTIQLASRSRKRFQKKFIAYEKQWLSGRWSENTLARHVMPLVEFTKPAHAEGFRRNMMDRFGVSS
jgi:RNA-directed DNA polymerase